MFVLVCVSLALAGLFLVRRLVPLGARESANLVTSITYGSTYVLYGITLAFSLYLGNQDFSQAMQTTNAEAGSLEALFETAWQLPQPERDRLQGLTESYARTVIEDEWPMMAGNTTSHESPRAARLVDELQQSVMDFEPKTSAEQTIYAQELMLATNLEEQRNIRLIESQKDTHRMLWYVLVTGGVITVVHSLFFGTEAVRLQALSVAALTTVVVLILAATYELQTPFAGIQHVEPVAFQETLDYMHGDNPGAN